MGIDGQIISLSDSPITVRTRTYWRTDTENRVSQGASQAKRVNQCLVSSILETKMEMRR